MNFRELAVKARTCRRFYEDQPLTMADLEWLVDCARLDLRPKMRRNCASAW